MNATIAVLVGYLVILFVMAIWSRTETRSLAGFYLAGKKLPYWVVAFSTNATGESGWLLLGLSGMGYLVGASAYWVVVGEIVGIDRSICVLRRGLRELGIERDTLVWYCSDNGGLRPQSSGWRGIYW